VGGEGGEMTQTMYAHMNKIKIKKKERKNERNWREEYDQRQKLSKLKDSLPDWKGLPRC
jgi:hypothetical protein